MSVLGQLALHLDAQQVNGLYRHYTLLEKWNQQINLTGIRDPEEIVLRHFGESLAVAKVIGPGAGAVVDIGSGGGFPGAPVSVCYQGRPVTLVESVQKKGIFLKEVAREQANLSVFVGRLQEFKGRVEWATMRGVAPAEVVADIGRVAQKVALIISAEKCPQVVSDLRVEGPEVLAFPWDSRTVVVAGVLP